jgi:hypothetical protein
VIARFHCASSRDFPLPFNFNEHGQMKPAEKKEAEMQRFVAGKILLWYNCDKLV